MVSNSELAIRNWLHFSVIAFNRLRKRHKKVFPFRFTYPNDLYNFQLDMES